MDEEFHSASEHSPLPMSTAVGHYGKLRSGLGSAGAVDWPWQGRFTTIAPVSGA